MEEERRGRGRRAQTEEFMHVERSSEWQVWVNLGECRCR